MTAPVSGEEVLEEEALDADHASTGDDRHVEDDAAAGAATARPWSGPSAGRWAVFVGIAVTVVAVDQLSKAWITGNLDPAAPPIRVVGDWLRIVYGRNSGILFGMLPQSAAAFAVVSLIVIGLIVVYHRRTGRGIVTTVALGLLLGGAIGNLLDRVHYGAVVDWVDMGIGAWRFYTYNVADAAITTAIILLLLMAVAPRVAEWGADG